MSAQAVTLETSQQAALKVDASWSVRSTSRGQLLVRFTSELINVQDRWLADDPGLVAVSSGVRRSAELALGGRVGLVGPEFNRSQCHILQRLGENLLKAYSGRCPDKIRRHMRALDQATGDRVPLLELMVDGDPPLQIAPVFSDDNEHFTRLSATRRPLAELAAGCFLGTRIATRTVRSSAGFEMGGNDRLSATDDALRIRLRPFTNARLHGVRDHLQRLAAVTSLDIEPAQPDSASLTAQELAERLIAAPGRDCLHVVAHCRVSRAADEFLEDCLIFAIDRRRRRQVNLSTGLLDSVGPDRAPVGPLAVLIACAASNERADVPISLPALFQRAGYRCVLAPITSIRVEVGYRFIEQFYGQLSPTTSVAEALVSARMAMLQGIERGGEKAGCAIGLLFQSHGNSFLRG